MEVRISVRRTMALLSAVILAFLVLCGLVWVLVLARGLSRDLVWFKLLDLDSERNAPTLFGSVELLACTGLLIFIGQARGDSRRLALPWIALALIFVFLALDETAQFPEALIKPLRLRRHTSGMLYQAWMLLCGLGLLLLGLLYLRWLVRLPARTRLFFGISAVVYLGGALFLEMVGGLHRSWRPDDRPPPSTAVLAAIEEGLEIAGTLVFIGSLMDYIQRHLGGWRILLPALAGKSRPSDGAW